jgi:hypothetical protein
MNSPPPSTACRSVALQSGVLHLEIEHADVPLEELCGFASRRSRKRGFVFVSKVLGKHYPVRPRRMEETHRRLALRLLESRIDTRALPGPVVVIALAETATALGQGVYEHLWQLTGRTDLLFLHTTRYRLQQPLALHFEESHSHATEHLLYEPLDSAHRELSHRAATLILVDDEISTGHTLVKLARAYWREHPALRRVQLVCLTDWLGQERREQLGTTVGLPVKVHSLLQGRFTFVPNPNFDPGLLPAVGGNGRCKDAYLPRNLGRLGWRGRLDVADHVRQRVGPVGAGERILVLGTGEFAYPPFRLACQLENDGADVWYQSTTRSPLLVDGDLQSVLEFTDNYHDDMPNFVYNVLDRDYHRVIIGYETDPLPPAHRLAEQLRGQVVGW